MISSVVAPSPNGELGGLSFQPNAGAPPAFSGRLPSFNQIARAVAPPTGNFAGAPILADRPGQQSNATIQYSRVVPLISQFDRAMVYGLKRGTLVFVVSLNGRGSLSAPAMTLTGPPLSITDTFKRSMTTPQGSIGNRARLNMSGQQLSEIISWPVMVHMSVDKADKLVVNVAGADSDINNPNYGLDTQYSTQALGSGALIMYDNADIVIDSFNSLRTNVLFAQSAFLMPFSGGRTFPETSFNEILRPPGNTDPDDKLPLVSNLSKLTKYLLDGEKCIGAFVPDGFVLNKFDTEQADDVEAMFDANQHGLYNIAVHGHALCTSYAEFGSNKRKRDGTTMPRDELYVLVVATPVATTASNNTLQKIYAQIQKGEKADNRNDAVTMYQMTKNIPAGALYSGTSVNTIVKTTAFANVRYQRATSNQLRNLSHTRFVMPRESIVAPQEIVVGAWKIGSVVDNAAARLDVDGRAFGVKSTYGLTASTAISWVSAFELYDKFDFEKQPQVTSPTELVKSEWYKWLTPTDTEKKAMTKP